jgi:hypothetical protein
MPLKVGSKSIVGVYVGDKRIVRGYDGDKLVFDFEAGGGEGIEFEYLGHTNGGTAASQTLSAQDIGAADDNRVVALLVAWTGATGADRTLNSATIGGVSATIIPSGNTAGRRCAIVHAAVPSGTTANLAFTWSGTLNHVRVGRYRLVPETATPLDSGTGTSESVANAVISDIEVAAGGALLSVCIKSNDNSTYSASWSGVDTLTLDENLAGSTNARHGFASCAITAISTTDDLTWTSDAVPKRAVAASWI